MEAEEQEQEQERGEEQVNNNNMIPHGRDFAEYLNDATYEIQIGQTDRQDRPRIKVR